MAVAQAVKVHDQPGAAATMLKHLLAAHGPISDLLRELQVRLR